MRREAVMKTAIRLTTASISTAFALALLPAAARAQSTPPSSPPPKLITYRGPEIGVDVTAGRRGEIGFYAGASSTRGSLTVRVAAMETGESVPCSIGIGYEYMFSRDRARITPVAGASLGRVFSCATESDGPRPSPSSRSVGTFSGGVRIPMFAGHRTVGSLKVLAFSQRQFGDTSASDITSKGLSIGFVLGRR
jgi:hypothetical protein